MSDGEAALAGQGKGVMLVGQLLAVSNQVFIAAVSTPSFLHPVVNFHASFIFLLRLIYSLFQKAL